VGSGGTGYRQLWLASVVVVASLLLALVEVGIYLGHGPPRVNRSLATVELWQYVLQGSAMAVAGFVVLARRRARVLGWILLGGALPFMAAACLSTWLRYTTAITPAVAVAVYAEALLWNVPRVLFAVLGLYFPDGRLPGRWARPVAIGLPVATLLYEAVGWLTLPSWTPGGIPMPNRFYVPGLVGVAPRLEGALDLVIWVGLLVAAVSPLARWRRASRLSRRQIAIALPCFLLFLAVAAVREQVWAPWVAGAVLAVAVLWPAAIGYVIVRDRLYVLDRAARRIVAGAVPVALLAVVYAAAAVVMSAALPGEGAALAAVLAVLAALVGLVLRPVGAWVSMRVDRLLYGDRAEPYQLARQLAARLRDGVGPAQVPDVVCQIVVSALRLPAAALEASGGRRLAGVGTVTSGEPVELRYHGQLVGRLLAAPRAGQDRLDELDRAALQALADLAAPAVSALSLRKELAASRAQLVAAGEVERRRLRRDVHDGLGPSLAAIRLQVETALAVLPPGSPSGSLLTDAARELREIGAELRRITDDQLPPALERLGLGGALAELIDRLSNPALRIELDLPDRLPALAPVVELAAYRIAAEALANAIRHSGGTRATVRLTDAGDGLVLTVTDDGTGIPAGAGRTGLGLRSMAERAADLGGTCQVRGGRTGTTLTARLPHAAAASRR
jgi:two-component system, NarL family, sensor kinase